MPTETKQKQKHCKTCNRKTLHVATITTHDVGCGFIAGNLLLCVVTLGIWFPFAVLLFGLCVFGNSIGPLGAKYLCQVCGRRN